MNNTTPAQRLAVAADKHGLWPADAARFADIREEFNLTVDELTPAVIDEAHRLHRQSIRKLKDRIEAVARPVNVRASLCGVEVSAVVKPARKPQRKTEKRAKVFGFSSVSVIRWMGANGWDLDDAGTALLTITGQNPADATLRKQLKAGRDGHGGTIAPISDSQARRLKDATK